MYRLVGSRWFALADLILILGCGALWLGVPGIGGWLILVALLPWAVRLAAGLVPYQRSILNLPITIFLLSAGVGVWAAYNREAALAKFWVLVGAALLYFALTRQPGENWGFITGLFGIVGVLISIYFLLTQDWNTYPGDLENLNRFGMWLMAKRPEWPLLGLPANAIAGSLAMLLPFAVALGLDGKRKRRWDYLSLALVTGGVMGAVLILTSSRGAWLALLAGGGLWLLWRASQWIGQRKRWKPLGIFMLGLLAFGLMGLLMLAIFPGGLAGLVDRVPGLPDGSSRLELAWSGWKLFQDFPITGSGLHSFPGLFSQYILVIPYFKFDYSHNFLLDVALEQGLLGWAALVAIFAGSAWLLARFIAGERTDLALYAEAALASLAVVFLHGLIDDALYGGIGMPLLFLVPGVAVGLNQRAGEVLPVYWRQPNFQKWLALAALAFVMIVVLLIAMQRPISSAWNSNLGAVALAQHELAGWPRNEWDENPDVRVLQPARERFLHALQMDPQNRTAHHRLGLIALQGRDFETAREQLLQAYRIDPGHRGIQKALGYAETWSGALEEGAAVLSAIPEAQYEMGFYVSWWKKQGRRDLAGQANEMVQILRGMTPGNFNQKENRP